MDGAVLFTIVRLYLSTCVGWFFFFFLWALSYGWLLFDCNTMDMRCKEH